LLPAGVLAVSCAGRYVPADLSEGIDLRVDDAEHLVESATLIAFYELAENKQISQQIGAGGPIVIDPGLEGYDVIVAYRTGPYCAIPPSVAVLSTDGTIVVEVVSHNRGNCDAMEYDEAIGLDFNAARGDRPVEIQHGLD
jgi:hypothetical protein